MHRTTSMAGAGVAIAGLLCLVAAGAAQAQAPAAPPAQEIVRAGAQASLTGPDDYFTGRVRVDPMWPANTDINSTGGLVTFEPGARSAWHTHPRGQRLVVMSGVGLTQEWGKPTQLLRPGDVVWCPPGVKHWHGAGPTAAMTHLHVTGTEPDGRTSPGWKRSAMRNTSHGERFRRFAGALIAMTATIAGGLGHLPAWGAGEAAKTNVSAQPLLSQRQRSIPPIVAAMAVGDMPQLNAALGRGLDAGLTVNEAKEILVQLYAYTGFPRSLKRSAS